MASEDKATSLNVSLPESLKAFVEDGGTLIAFDASTDLPIEHFGLPVRNSLGELPPDCDPSWQKARTR